MTIQNFLARRALGGRSLVLGLLLATLFLSSCAFFEDKPDEKTAVQRLSAMVALGWQWLHVDSVQVLSMRSVYDGYEVSFAYDVVFGKNETELTEDERLALQRFLPMCAAVPVARGNRCGVRESLVFVQTKDHGWMPELVLRFNKLNSDDIVGWTPAQLPEGVRSQ